MSQCTHVENHAYANKSRRMYIHDVCQLSNPVNSRDTKEIGSRLTIKTPERRH